MRKTLVLKQVGKKQYYRDPLKGVLRNIENPRDTYIPETRIAVGRLLDKVRVYEDEY